MQDDKISRDVILFKRFTDLNAEFICTTEMLQHSFIPV